MFEISSIEMSQNDTFTDMWVVYFNTCTTNAQQRINLQYDQKNTKEINFFQLLHKSSKRSINLIIRLDNTLFCGKNCFTLLK